MVSFWREPSSGPADGCLLPVFSHSWERSPKPARGALPSWPHPNLITSQSPPFLYQCIRRLDCAYIFLGVHIQPRTETKYEPAIFKMKIGLSLQVLWILKYNKGMLRNFMSVGSITDEMENFLWLVSHQNNMSMVLECHKVEEKLAVL